MKYVKLFESFDDQISLEQFGIEVDKATQMIADDPVAAAMHMKKIFISNPWIKREAEYMKRLQPFGIKMGQLSPEQEEEVKKAMKAYELEITPEEDRIAQEEMAREREKAAERESERAMERENAKARHLEVLYKVKSGEMEPEEALAILNPR